MKIVFLLLISILLSFGNEIEDTQFANIRVGSNLNGTAVIGTDLMTSAKTLKEISIGIGFDFVGYEGAKKATQTYGNSYSLGAEFKVGYNLKSLIILPIHLKAGIGYGVTRYDASNDWGIVYDAAIEIHIYKRLGIGTSYKVSQTNTLNEDSKATLCYVTYGF